MRVVAEVQRPIHFPFVGNIQPETGVSKAQLQRSIALIPDAGASIVSAAIRKQVIEEAQAQA
jgi:hypothetical protein